jgi:hypothetical protein
MFCTFMTAFFTGKARAVSESQAISARPRAALSHSHRTAILRPLIRQPASQRRRVLQRAYYPAIKQLKKVLNSQIYHKQKRVAGRYSSASDSPSRSSSDPHWWLLCG